MARDKLTITFHWLETNKIYGVKRKALPSVSRFVPNSYIVFISSKNAVIVL